MEYSDVIRQSVKAFREGRFPEQMDAVKEEGLKYTPEYFDQLEEKLLGKDTKDEEAEDGDV